MGASAAVAVLIRKEKDLVEHFRRAGAVTPADAQSPSDLGVHERLAWSRLLSRAVIREAAPGTFYLDEARWDALRRIRRRAALLVLALAVILAAIAMLTTVAARG